MESASHPLASTSLQTAECRLLKNGNDSSEPKAQRADAIDRQSVCARRGRVLSPAHQHPAGAAAPRPASHKASAPGSGTAGVVTSTSPLV